VSHVCTSRRRSDCYGNLTTHGARQAGFHVQVPAQVTYGPSTVARVSGRVARCPPPCTLIHTPRLVHRLWPIRCTHRHDWRNLFVRRMVAFGKVPPSACAARRLTARQGRRFVCNGCGCAKSFKSKVRMPGLHASHRAPLRPLPSQEKLKQHKQRCPFINPPAPVPTARPADCCSAACKRSRGPKCGGRRWLRVRPRQSPSCTPAHTASASSPSVGGCPAWLCVTCAVPDPVASLMLAHVRNRHRDGPRRNVCAVCDRAFVTPFALREHRCEQSRSQCRRA
jgi:hypothetical protein